MTKEAMDTSETSDDYREKMQNYQPVYVRVPVKHANLGIRSQAMDMSTMVELTSFSTLGKIQPFLVTITSTAALLVDLHCHLTDKEVCGYLGGHWDINTHNLTILGAFPCRYAGKEKSTAAAIEAEIARTMQWKRMTLVGWYHSHPRSHASPSLRDVDAQLDYQIKMKGHSENGYTPCVGLICSPYNADANCYESNFNVFWSMPPPENRPHEYPRPMLLSYTLTQDQFIAQEALDEITKCVEYHKVEGGVDFTAALSGNTTYLDRLKTSLVSKLPGRNRSNCSYWDVIREMVCPGAEDSPNEAYLPIKFPIVSESLLQHSPGNVFIAPVNYKSDNVSPMSKSYNHHQLKDHSDSGMPQQSQHLLGNDPISTFRTGDLTVSLKNSKSEYEYPTSDFSKRSGVDFSQHISAYVRNIANLFGPLGKSSMDMSAEVERRPGEYSSMEMLQNAFKTPGSSLSPSHELYKNMAMTSDDYSGDRGKKMGTEAMNLSGNEDSKGNNFGGIIDMTAGHRKKMENEESLNLSKDR